MDRTAFSPLAPHRMGDRSCPAMEEPNGARAAEGGEEAGKEAPRLVEIESMLTGEGDETLWDVLRRVAAVIFPADGCTAHPPPPSLLQRIRSSLAENTPRLPGACRRTGRELLVWARRGSPLRALLLLAVGTIILLALTALLVFMLFFLGTTFNAIIVSLLVSLAAAGGFLALFFACLTAFYIGALSVAVFVISTTTIAAIIAVLIATGWIGFLLVVWLSARKSVGLAKQSLTMTGSALSAYSAAHRAHGHPKADE